MQIQRVAGACGEGFSEHGCKPLSGNPTSGLRHRYADKATQARGNRSNQSGAAASRVYSISGRILGVRYKGLVYSVESCQQNGAHSMSDKPKDEDCSAEKATVTLPGTVEKIIPSLDPSEPEKVQIGVEGAEQLYREIRIDNTLQDEAGNAVSLKEGADVEVTIEAEPEATTPKKKSGNPAS